jgi:hypothetical protein
MENKIERKEISDRGSRKKEDRERKGEINWQN